MLKKSIVLILCIHVSMAGAETPIATHSPSELQAQAIAAFKAGQYGKAAGFYQQLAIVQPSNTDVLKDLMWSYWNARDYSNAIVIGKQLLILNPHDAETQSVIGRSYQAMGDKQNAIIAFQKVTAARPDNISAQFSLIRAQIQAGNLKDAEALLIGLEKEIPNNPSLRIKLAETWKGVARSYSDEGDQTKAITIYERVLGISGNSPQVQLALARLQIDQKNYDAAEATLMRLLNRAPDYISVYPKLATVMFLKGNFGKSADMWETAIKAYPDHSEYKLKRVHALYFDGQYDLAMKEADALLPDPKVGRKTLDFIFDDAFSRKDYRAAIKVMEDTLPYYEKEVDDQRRMVRLAGAYEEMGAYDESMRVLNEALENYPGDGEAVTSKAALLMRAGRPRAAIKHIKGVLAANPGVINLLPTLADAYELVGNYSGQRQIIQQYRKADPTNPYLLLKEAEIVFLLEKYSKAKRMLMDWLKDNQESAVLPILLYHGLTAFKRDGMLAYTQNHTTEVFESQIKALAEAGFHPVTVPQVNDWYSKGTPLPQKPILITFDDGRLDSFRLADPILKKYNMKATMFVICQNVERNLPNYASWAELRKLKETGRWDLQDHSDKGHGYIQIASEGYKGLFLINKKWLPEENRFETRQEWVDRINADHYNGKQKIKENLGIDPVGFAFPQGNFWQANIPNAQDSTTINLSAVRNYFSLSFLQDTYGLNVHSRDPYLLNRLEPPRKWTGADLVRHISDQSAANQMRVTLLHWALWQSHPHEAYYWLDELKKANASPQLLAYEGSNILVSRGNVPKAQQLEAQVADADGKVEWRTKKPDPVKREKSLTYEASANFFNDTDDRQSWTFNQNLATGRIGYVKYRAIQELGNYREPGVPHISESAGGLGFNASLGFRNNLDVQGMYHSFNNEANDQYSGKVSLSSEWKNGLYTRLDAIRQPLFYGKALNADIHGATGDLEVKIQPDNRWDVVVYGEGTHYSDDNEHFTGQLLGSHSLSSGSSPRILYRFGAQTNKDPSPFYYSPKSLIENNLGLSQAFRIRIPYKLTLTYLPGIGKESEHGTRFVQNFKTELECQWLTATSLKLNFTYGQNPTYISRRFDAVFQHRFGYPWHLEKTADAHARTPEAPQPETADVSPF